MNALTRLQSALLAKTCDKLNIIMTFITILLSFIAGASLIFYFLVRNLNYWKNRNVLGPKPVLLFGNIKKSALRYNTSGEVLKHIYNSYPDEKVVGIFRMTEPALLVRDLDLLKHLLIKDSDNFTDRGFDFSTNGLGQNLFFSDGDTWKALRTRLSPIFTHTKLKNMMHLLNDRGDKLVDYVNEITAVTPEHVVHDLMQKFTMSAVTACAFGLDIDTFHDDIETLKRLDKDIFSPNIGIELDMMFPGLAKRLNVAIFPRYMLKFFKGLVKTVLTQRNGKPSGRKDLIDLILEIRNKKQIEVIKGVTGKDSKTIEITDNVMEAQAFIFYAAGYESTASTMTFLLYQLALDINIQDRLRKEIDEYLQRHDNRIELDTLKELTYLDQVFSETLRMYPIGDNLQRRTRNDYVFPGTNVKVVKGQMVMISVSGIQHDEKYYPEPEKFDPDRFSPEKVADRHACAYLPFGLGPRHCIGQRFAYAQSRVGLIRLLSKFRVEAGKNTVRSFSFDPYRLPLAPDKAFYIYIYKRDL